MCHTQSYFEAGIPVWIPNSNPQTLKSVKIKCKALVTVRCRRATRAMFLALNWASLQRRPPTQTRQLHHGFSTRYARQKTAPPLPTPPPQNIAGYGTSGSNASSRIRSYINYSSLIFWRTITSSSY